MMKPALAQAVQIVLVPEAELIALLVVAIKDIDDLIKTTTTKTDDTQRFHVL